MHHRPVRLFALLSALALIASTPAAALSAATAPLAAGRQRHESALRVVADARTQLHGQSLADAVTASATLRGLVPLPVPVAAPPADATAQRVPLPLRPAVARLLGAVQAAGAAGLAALPLDDPAFVGAADTLLATGVSDSALVARLTARVDAAQVAGAGRALAHALDHNLPVLRRHAAIAAAADGGVAHAVGCDVVDQPPALCIGGTGTNVYAKDYGLLIDLGGNDTYTNAAGGADPLGNGLPASVAVDLGGDDLYRAALPSASGARAALGSVQLGGVGMLVDTGGNDTYAVTSTTNGIDTHGLGFAFGGVGLVADLVGDDHYLVRHAPPAGPGNVRSGAGLGYSTLGGIGIVVDGRGDDTYTVEAAPTEYVDETGVVFAGVATMQGIAVGVAGAGVLADGGGKDTFTLQAIGTPVAPDEQRTVERSPGATTQGLGVGEVAGVGVLLTGTGATRYTARSHTQGQASRGSGIEAFGVGGLAGLGVLEDAGGDDVYTGEAVSNAERVVRVGDECVNPLDDEAPCDVVDGSTHASAASVIGMGFASLGAVGILHDAGGNDRYSGSATVGASSTTEDVRTRVPSGDLGAFARATTGSALVRVQGVAAMNPTALTGQFAAGAALGQLLEDGAVGLLADSDGDDVYETRSTATAHASATSTASLTVEEASTIRAVSESQGMGGGGGYGELRDVGGKDRYAVLNTSEATVAHEGVASPGPTLSSVQGSGPTQESSSLPSAALLSDIDGGAADTFLAVPQDPTCSGSRGQATWRDCDSQFAGGVNN